MLESTAAGSVGEPSQLVRKLRRAALQILAASLGIPFGLGVLVIAMTLVAWQADTTLAAVLNLSLVSWVRENCG